MTAPVARLTQLAAGLVLVAIGSRPGGQAPVGVGPGDVPAGSLTQHPGVSCGPTSIRVVVVPVGAPA